jgi:hypothetical protein
VISLLETTSRPDRTERGVPIAVSLPATIFGPLTILVAHLALGPMLQQNQPLATFHAVATLAVGVGVGMSLTQPVARAAYAAGYIVSSEVLWRMTRAGVVWEFGKYAVSLLCLVALARHGRFKLSARPAAVWYFALLLPSAAITMADLPFNDARQDVSFNLSGPFALFITSLFFSQVRLDASERRTLFVALLAPLLSVASIAYLGIVSTPDLVFGTQSSLQSSGNFGPNQVSAALGLGALVALLSMLHDEGSSAFKVVMGVVMVFLAMQSALTMSRGGLYSFAGAAVIAFVLSLGDARMRQRFFVTAGVIGVLSYYVLLPRLDAWTDGKLLARFENASLTGRDEIAGNDIEIWTQYPIFGVGPGRAGSYRQTYSASAASHTELTRVLSEHGLLGFGSLLALATLLIGNLRRCESTAQRAIAASLMAWALLFMLNAGMRLAAPSFVIGLSAAHFVTRKPPPPEPEPPMRSVSRK